MDPNADLEEMRRLITRIREAEDAARVLDDAMRVVELVEALDGWISNGCSMPSACEKDGS